MALSAPTRLSVRTAMQHPELVNEIVKRTTSTSTTEITESADEQAARLKKEDRMHIFNIAREATLILLSIVFLGIVVYICFNFLMLNPSATPDDKKWATAILFALASAVGGFLTGSKMSVVDK